jgi:predicted amidophosphoribosyltransferase
MCPRCREEYLATVELCVHCGVALVAAGELPPEEQAAPLPPLEELVRVRVENPVWIQTLADHLAEEGIPSRVELLDGDGPVARRHGAPCALYVRPDDVERARQVDEELLRVQLPDLPEGADTGWSEAEGCPACGAAVDAHATECPDCGLGFAEDD